MTSKSEQPILPDRGRLDTERPNADSEQLDAMSAEQICRVINAADADVPTVVAAEIPRIAALAEIVA